MRYYGLIDEEELEVIAEEVCRALSKGRYGTAKDLLIETAKAETGAGTIRDRTPNKYGVGLMQFDRVGFDNVRLKAMHKWRDKVLRELHIDMKLVEYEHLIYNPLLSVLWARLYYLLIPEPIPKTIEERARYWKKYYNTEAGKGTPEHYLRMSGVTK